MNITLLNTSHDHLKIKLKDMWKPFKKAYFYKQYYAKPYETAVFEGQNWL